MADSTARSSIRLNSDDTLMDTAAACEFLGGLAEITLRKWRCNRRGPAFVRLGSVIRYRLGDLRAFVEANRSAA